MLEDLREQRDVGPDAEDRIVTEGGERPSAGGLARFAARDQLREQRIVVDPTSDPSVTPASIRTPGMDGSR